jgi:type IV pilus assembly protein PilV
MWSKMLVAPKKQGVGAYCGFNQQGYLLIETLVVSALIGVGILAMAHLQRNSLTLGNSSLLRTKATFLAYDMADRIRANMAAQATGSYNSLISTPSNPGCISTGCTTAQMAQNDYYEWVSELALELPSGHGVVCLTSTPSSGTFATPACDSAGNVLAIKIWWTQKNEGSGETAGTGFFYTTVRP